MHKLPLYGKVEGHNGPCDDRQSFPKWAIAWKWPQTGISCTRRCGTGSVSTTFAFGLGQNKRRTLPGDTMRQRAIDVCFPFPLGMIDLLQFRWLWRSLGVHIVPIFPHFHTMHCGLDPNLRKDLIIRKHCTPNLLSNTTFFSSRDVIRIRISLGHLGTPKKNAPVRLGESTRPIQPAAPPGDAAARSSSRLSQHPGF
jgi:hypothetical protein